MARFSAQPGDAELGRGELRKPGDFSDQPGQGAHTLPPYIDMGRHRRAANPDMEGSLPSAPDPQLALWRACFSACSELPAPMPRGRKRELRGTPKA